MVRTPKVCAPAGGVATMIAGSPTWPTGTPSSETSYPATGGTENGDDSAGGVHDSLSRPAAGVSPRSPLGAAGISSPRQIWPSDLYAYGETVPAASTARTAKM